MKAVLLKKYGSNDLSCVDVAPPTTMGKNDLYIQHTAIPICVDDVKFVSGVVSPYRLNKNLSGKDVVGFAGVGKILKVGSAVRNFKVGQRVVYPFGGLGSHCEKRIINNNFCFQLSEKISDKTAASIIRDGLLAHTMLFQAVTLRRDNVILIHDISNPLSQIICKWARFFNLKIVVSILHESHRSLATACGAGLVLHYQAKDFVESVKRFTDNFGVNAVYDMLGKEVVDLSLDSLRMFGVYLQSYAVKNSITNISVERLSAKSLFFTAPILEHYKSSRDLVVLSLQALSDACIKGSVFPKITEYKLSEANRAYQDIALGKVSGSVVLIP